MKSTFSLKMDLLWLFPGLRPIQTDPHRNSASGGGQNASRSSISSQMLPKNLLQKSPERRVVMPAGAFKFLKSGIQQKCFGTKAPSDGLSCPQGPLNFSKMTSGKMIWGKSPERRVVMPAGAFEFLKNDIRQKWFGAKAPDDGLSCPQCPYFFFQK